MNTQAEVPKILLSKREAALALSLSVRTIENLIARKELIARRVGRRTLVVATSLQSFARRDHGSPSPSKRSAVNEAQGGCGQDAVL
ncbi:MAG TPA: helix-turn-helix domain-containing protein [Candidatus Aquilonibacter sp.]|nr:helix-turn-helix domain-containing protein [Candidatus Aquilonibacter sp.]